MQYQGARLVTEEFAPRIGEPEWLEPGLRRVLAPNPSPMTFLGTNTYILGEGDVAVIDPGPDDTRHQSAILSALTPGERISHIFVTHAHSDHSPLARPLSQRTGGAILAFGDAIAGRSAQMEELAQSRLIGGGEGVDTSFTPTVTLRDGEVTQGAGWQIRALWTPGHFGNHLSFQWGDRVFSGDHVMGWASSLISPPDGDMAAYMSSLDRMHSLDTSILYPGHGAPVMAPKARIEALRVHRLAREAAILSALDQEPQTIAELAQKVYTEVPPSLLPAARRNLFAHLVDLTARSLSQPDGELIPTARFTRR